VTRATPRIPRAIAADYRKVVLGDALPPAERAFLRDLLERNTTGRRPHPGRAAARLDGGRPHRDRQRLRRSERRRHRLAPRAPPRSSSPCCPRRRTAVARPDEALIADAAAHVAAALA
jgi:beta-lactamase class A